jgi:hypothetical protein
MNTFLWHYRVRLACTVVLVLAFGWGMAQRAEVVFSGELDPKMADRLKAAVAAHPDHLQSRISFSRKHIWMHVQPGSALDVSFFEDLLSREGLHIECYYRSDVPGGSAADYAQFRACMDAQRTAGKAAAFNTCGAPLSICDNQVVPIAPWGPGGTFVFCPELPRNPIYDPFFGPFCPWVNPWGTGTNYGCLQSGENNTIWLRITISSPGNLEWAFRFPDYDGFNYLYMDWSLFPRTPTICADIASNNGGSAALRCNWNDWPETPNAATGMARLASAIPIPNEEDNFEESFAVVAGAEYLLLLDNYSGGTFNGTFDFSLSGTSAGVCGMILPMGHTELAAEVVDEGVYLGWFHLDAGSFAAFDIQRAGQDGVFSTIHPLTATAFYTSKRYLDTHPLAGKSQYRIRRIGLDGTESFSNVEEVDWNRAELEIFPQPAGESGFSVRLWAPATSLQVYDTKGQWVYGQSLIGTDNIHFIQAPLSAGFYVVEIRDVTGQLLRKKLVVE